MTLYLLLLLILETYKNIILSYLILSYDNIIYCYVNTKPLHIISLT